jgi:hypothetical protein
VKHCLEVLEQAYKQCEGMSLDEVRNHNPFKELRDEQKKDEKKDEKKEEENVKLRNEPIKGQKIDTGPSKNKKVAKEEKKHKKRKTNQ